MKKYLVLERVVYCIVYELCLQISKSQACPQHIRIPTVFRARIAWLHTVTVRVYFRRIPGATRRFD